MKEKITDEFNMSVADPFVYESLRLSLRDVGIGFCLSLSGDVKPVVNKANKFWAFRDAILTLMN